MHNAESILVIILSTVLTIFLIVAIMVMVLIAGLLKAIRRLVEKAEQIVDSAEEAAAVLRNASGPLALFKLIRNIIAVIEKMHHNNGR